MTTSGDRSDTSLGPYRLLRRIGRGGMGEVYEALDTVKDRTVALKLLPAQFADDAEYRARFLRESQTVARLNDPHVIPIHDFGEIDGQLFLDMRLVSGGDLSDRIAAGPVPPAQAVDVIGQIAGALDTAHAAGLTHRDVKPENILLDPNGFAYLVDFGLVQSAGQTALTSTGAAIGSFNYMAPERFAGGPVGPPSDVYALGCVLYETLTGAKPFGADSMEQIIAGHLHRPLPPTGTAFDPVIARATAKDPAQRYAGAGALAAAARAALSGPLAAGPLAAGTAIAPADYYEPTRHAPVAAHSTPQPQSSSRAPLLAAVAAVVALALAGGGFWLWQSGRSEPAVAVTAPSTEQTSTPTTPAAPARAAGDLGLSTPISTPACDGSVITVVTSPLGDAPTAEVAQALAAHPGASYLRADQSCSSLRSRDENGNVIYAVYYPGCAMRHRIEGAYGRRLDDVTPVGTEVC